MLQKSTLIVVNCRFLTQPISGVQRFAIELCRELKKLNNEFIFVTPKNVIHHTICEELEAITIGRFKGHFWEQIDLKRYVEKHNALLISLCNTAPLFVKKQLITIHDLSFIHHPKWFSYTFRKLYNFLIPRIAKKAIHILTVSETSKLEITKILNIKSDKVSVIYNAVAPIFKNYQKYSDTSNTVIDQYILTVSSHHPRKNFKRLVCAFIDLNNQDFNLIIVGNFNKHFRKEHIPSSDRILYLENVQDEELITLYRNAALFVYPSLYEGFGIPIIEAMSLGINVCVSGIPVFKEICGENAVYFNPNSVKDIKEKIQTSLIHPKKIDGIFIERFSWQKSAEKVIKIINNQFDD